MDNNISRYELVHRISQLAKEKEMANRNPIEDKKNDLFKEINKPKKKRNYVKEAFDEIIGKEGGF